MAATYPPLPPPVLRSSQLLINILPAGGPTPKNPGKRGTRTPRTRDPKESRRAPELLYHSLPPSGRLEPGSIRTTHPLPPQCLKPAATAVWYNCLVERAILKRSVKTWRPMRLRCKPPSSEGSSLPHSALVNKGRVSGHETTALLPGKTSQEAVEGDIQVTGLLPVAATWQHWGEHYKAGCIEAPHRPVYRLHLLLDDGQVLLPATLVFPPPVI